MGILIAIIALLLIYIFSPFMIFYSIITTWNFKNISKYFFNISVGIDQLGNIIASNFFNHILIKEDGVKFGDPDETISSVIGRNYLMNTLLPIGKLLRWTLDKIQYNHCINSIEK